MQALYPEWTICVMPSAALEEEEAADEGELLCPFVGNAVMYGDPCCWHKDADPRDVSPNTPWAQQYGIYTNR